jgi:succinyl-CoA synthetase alpha subunit
MPVGCAVREGQYFDSVFLMRVADRMSAHPGVAQAAAVMGTPANKDLLAEAGFTCVEIGAAGANDLIVGVQAERAEVVRDVLERLETWLEAEVSVTSTEERARTLDEALARSPEADLALISVPGEHAAREARRALERGLHVFLFSDNVALEDEVALKREAAERGLVVMGPDCGTAIIRGKGIGFANAVRRGPIGVVGASGTGIQELTTLVHGGGSGISHAIGTGSRDPSDEVGGVTTLAGLAALDADPGTAAIVLISKPPGRRTLERIRTRVGAATKPVVACFLGSTVDARGALWDVVRTIDEAATLALRHVGIEEALQPDGRGRDALARELRSTLSPDQRDVRGLFAGGSLCYQAQDIFRQAGIPVRSNAPLDGVSRLADPRRAEGHSLIDLGADEFTRGRPHPMIDPRLRRERILSESEDPAVGVLLLDVILGYGCAPDPAGDLAGAIAQAQRASERRGGRLAVVASVVGTEGDPQDAERQTRALREAGATVCASSAEAARLAAAIAGGS